MEETRSPLLGGLAAAPGLAKRALPPPARDHSLERIVLPAAAPAVTAAPERAAREATSERSLLVRPHGDHREAGDEGLGRRRRGRRRGEEFHVAGVWSALGGVLCKETVGWVTETVDDLYRVELMARMCGKEVSGWDRWGAGWLGEKGEGGRDLDGVTGQRWVK